MNLSDCCYYIDWHEVQALCPVYQSHGGDLSEIQGGYLTWSGTVSDLQDPKPSSGALAKQTDAWGWIQKVIPKLDHEPNQIKPKHSFYLRGECRVWKLK